MNGGAWVRGRARKKVNLRASEELEEAIQAATKVVSEGQSIPNTAKTFGASAFNIALGCLIYTCKHRKNDERAPP